MFEILKWQDGWLQIGLQRVGLVIERLVVAAVVLTLILQQLCERHKIFVSFVLKNNGF